MQVERKPSENVLQYYQRLKVGVAEGTIDLERSEIYGLLFGEVASADHARKALRTLDLAIEANECIVPEEGAVPLQGEADELPSKATVEINKDGTQSSSKLVRMRDEDTKNAEFLLRVHGYDIGFWELVSARSNIWNAYSKQDGIMELYSSKITVKPRKNGLDYKEIAQNFEKFAQNYTPKEVIPHQFEYGAECLVPCLFDVHFSKLADEDETGNKYNLEIARERVLASIDSYIHKLRNRKFEKIIFVIGNDYFNSEPSGSTIYGTKQDNDARYSKMFNKGVETLIEAIDKLSAISKVEVVLVQGNHAGYTEFYAACVLDAWYRNSTTVEVDSMPQTRKYRRFGKNLLGFAHGDSEKDRIFGLMQFEAAEDWGVTKTREWLLGHYHSEGTIEKNGVVVRRIPSLAGNDAWHMKSGFSTSRKRSMAFIYDKEQGLIETHYINI